MLTASLNTEYSMNNYYGLGYITHSSNIPSSMFPAPDELYKDTLLPLYVYWSVEEITRTKLCIHTRVCAGFINIHICIWQCIRLLFYVCVQNSESYHQDSKRYWRAEETERLHRSAQAEASLVLLHGQRKASFRLQNDIYSNSGALPFVRSGRFGLSITA